VLHQRYRQRYARYLLLVQDVSGQGNIQDAAVTSDEEDSARESGSELRNRPPDVCSLQGDACDENSDQPCSEAGPNGKKYNTLSCVFIFQVFLSDTQVLVCI
jgi:hypothetical protein